MKIDHAIVVLNYNGYKDTIQCIKSIKKSNNSPHIIIVDNASSDDSVEKINSAFSDVELIESKYNLGYAGGNNLGIKRALKIGAKVIHVLNNDTTVDHESLSFAYDFVKSTRKISSGKIYYTKGREFHENQKGRGDVLWYAGGEVDWTTGLAVHRGVDEPDIGQYDSIEKTEFITGCYFAAPSEAFETIGLFDENFFLYLEDADFSLRARDSGFETYYNPNIVIRHHNASSTISGSDFVDYYITRNRMLLAKKNHKYRLLLALIKDSLTRARTQSSKKRALLDFLLNRLGKNNEK